MVPRDLQGKHPVQLELSCLRRSGKQGLAVLDHLQGPQHACYQCKWKSLDSEIQSASSCALYPVSATGHRVKHIDQSRAADFCALKQ